MLILFICNEAWGNLLIFLYKIGVPHPKDEVPTLSVFGGNGRSRRPPQRRWCAASFSRCRRIPRTCRRLLALSEPNAERAATSSLFCGGCYVVRTFPHNPRRLYVDNTYYIHTYKYIYIYVYIYICVYQHVTHQA